MIGHGGKMRRPFSHPGGTDVARRFSLFSRCPVGTKHAETLRVMKPKAQVIVPEYQQGVEI